MHRMSSLALWVGVLFALPAASHHNFRSIFDMDQQIVIEGTVTEYQFINPHARVMLDVEKSGGAVENWIAEGGAVLVLRRLGWTGEEVAVGDRVSIAGNPARDGSSVLHWLTITLPDGRELFGQDLNLSAIDELRRRR